MNVESSKDKKSTGGINIERHSETKTVKLNDDVNVKTDDNLNLEKEKENIRLTTKKPSPKKDLKPNLSSEDLNNSNAAKVKPKLVSLDGLDLLTNPRKTNQEYSDHSDRNDDVISEHSSDSDSDSAKSERHYGSSTGMFEPRDDLSEGERRRRHDSVSVTSRSSRGSRGSRGSRSSRSSSSESEEPERPKTYEEIQREKHILLARLERLEKQLGIKASRRFTPASNIEDIKYEYEKLKRQRDIDRSIKFQRKILMGVVSGAEFLNRKFDPIDAKLDGWSESMYENLDEYDEVFEELHDKYSDKVDMPPEMKLLLMVAGSGFMFHLSNTLFKSQVPTLNDILKQNPDIMRSISQAAINNMGQSMGGAADDPMFDFMQQGIRMKQEKDEQRYQQQQQQQRHQQQQQQSNLHGPDGVDDILSQLSGKRSGNPSDNRVRQPMGPLKPPMPSGMPSAIPPNMHRQRQPAMRPTMPQATGNRSRQMGNRRNRKSQGINIDI